MSSSIYTSGEYYEKHPDWHAKDSPFKASNILKIIERNNLNPKTICEVGCGIGEILVNLYSKLSDETEFFGYEISPQAYEVCKSKERERLHFYLSDFVENENKHYDLVMAIDVIEHVEDHMNFLKKLRSKTESVIFHIPLDMNALAIIREHPIINSRKSVGHLHYFTKNTALMTLEDCGYTIIDYFYTTGGFDLSGGSIKHRLFKIPRRVFFGVNQDLAARLFGGFSLMVLAK